MSEDANEEASKKEYDEKIINHFNKQVEPVVNITDKLKDVISPKDATLKQQLDLKTLPEEFNVKNIGDLNYLTEIFSPKYDQFHSLNYLNKTRELMLADGYPDGSTMNEYLFWGTMSRKLQIIYQRMHAQANRKKGVNEDEAENMGLLKEMRAVSEQVSSLQRTLDTLLDKRKKIKDVTDLHGETMDAAEKFITSHIGEFSHRCNKCGTIVNTMGLPHFAIMTEKNDKNEVVYHVFSPELWFLYRKGLIPLHYLALILRTSPEGILLTAEQRKEYGAQVLREDMKMLELEEESLKKLVKEYNANVKTE